MDGTAKYKAQTDSRIYATIAEGTLIDNAGNRSNTKNVDKQNYTDTTKPEAFNIQKVTNATNNTVQLIFNVTDQNYDSTDLLTTDEITITVDGENVNTIGKNLTSVEIKALINGTEKVVGHQYTLTLTKIAESTYQIGKDYLEWSGTLQATIDPNAVKDLNGNYLNPSTAVLSGFVDFIKPQVTYTHQETDIDYENKKYTMTFEVTDKYYESGEITLDNLTIQMKNGQIDENGNEIINDLKQAALDGKVDITLSKENKTATFRKTVSGAIEETATEHVIGHIYTLTISKLEQLGIIANSTTADYSGIVIVTIEGNVIKDSSLNGNSATTITSGIDNSIETSTILPSTSYTKPYLPADYSYSSGTLDTGLTIQDSLGNQYVWVEVPKTTEVYQTAGLSITEFTDAEYTKIENDLHTYTSVYRNGTSHTDTWSSQEATGLTENEYNIQKKKMLKSIYKNGGFYVGKYETGIDYNDANGYRTAEGATTQTPVIKQNAYVYNWVTTSQAQELASTMATGNYTSSLMFGVQWDLALKFMETKGVAQSELKSDSTSWGNYRNNLWTVSNTSAKYSTDFGSTYTSAPYTKTTSASILLTTGASSEFNKAGIYDLAGNVWEWTLEYTSSSNGPCVFRGGGDYHEGDGGPAGGRCDYYTGYDNSDVGFRVALYETEEPAQTSQPSYIPTGYTYVEGTIDTGYTIQDSSENQYVWVEVPQTTEVYPTAGLNITSFTDAEYEAIENDLHTYTSVYRNGTSYTDTWYSEDQHGMTETEYNTLKKKMLKSIYKNGGFYVGKYETGIDYNDANGYRTASGETTQTPVIKQNAYTYNYVTNKQAQELANTMATGNYTSSLMFGIQWNLILKFMETKGATQEELNSDSTSWGNSYNTLWTVSNISAKYLIDDENTYTSAPYTKTEGANVFLTTGASDVFSKVGIYDLAGNAWEWTLEYTSDPIKPCTNRGGSSADAGDYYISMYGLGTNSGMSHVRHRLPSSALDGRNAY